MRISYNRKVYFTSIFTNFILRHRKGTQQYRFTACNCRLTKDWPRFKEELDMLKFLCTDFWSSIYKRQVDNLRTNHQGVYVLMDNDFRFLSRLSSGSQYVEYAPRVRFCISFVSCSSLEKNFNFILVFST